MKKPTKSNNIHLKMDVDKITTLQTLLLFLNKYYTGRISKQTPFPKDFEKLVDQYCPALSHLPFQHRITYLKKGRTVPFKCIGCNADLKGIYSRALKTKYCSTSCSRTHNKSLKEKESKEIEISLSLEEFLKSIPKEIKSSTQLSLVQLAHLNHYSKSFRKELLTLHKLYALQSGYRENPTCKICGSDFIRFDIHRRKFSDTCSSRCMGKLKQEVSLETIKIWFPDIDFSKFKRKLSSDKSIIICKDHGESELSMDGIYYYMNRGSKSCCKLCNRGSRSSGEKEIEKFLQSLGLERNKDYKTGKRIIPPLNENQSNLELDFLFPDRNLAIEYNGSYYHSDIFKDKEYYKHKSDWCKENNIHLFHIWEVDFKSNPSLIKSMIKSKLGLITNKIFARKLTFRKVDKRIAQQFLDDNHLLGRVGGKHFGLFQEEELISIMTFKENNLVRFSSKKELIVVGGFTKLLKNCCKVLDLKEVFTFSDNDYSLGGVYEKNGFSPIKIIPESYFYVHNSKRKSRQTFMIKEIEKKFQLDRNNFQEFSNKEFAMIQHINNHIHGNTIYRVLDSGKIKWKLTCTNS